MVFDPSDHVVDKIQFEDKDWTAAEFCSHTEEELPVNIPIPRGFGFFMRAYIDSDHAGDSITCRYRTEFLV